MKKWGFLVALGLLALAMAGEAAADRGRHRGDGARHAHRGHPGHQGHRHQGHRHFGGHFHRPHFRRHFRHGHAWYPRYWGAPYWHWPRWAAYAAPLPLFAYDWEPPVYVERVVERRPVYIERRIEREPVHIERRIEREPVHIERRIEREPVHRAPPRSESRAPSYAAAEPSAPLRERRERLDRLTLSATELFAFDEASIAAPQPDLDALARAMKANPRIAEVRITGYTDRLGAQGYNLELSRKRAQAVKGYLVKQGVEAFRLIAVGRGEADPVVQCGEKDPAALVRCLEPNRRVVVEEVRVERPGGRG